MSGDEIEKALKECELIDSLIPEALPLYINHKWVTEDIRRRYLNMLEDAENLMERNERLSKNLDNGEYLKVEF